MNAAVVDGERRARVLCVDDEPAMLRSLQWLLQRDFEVATAAGADAALQRLAEADYDVVVSDQRMPGMSGSELLREVRRRSPRAMRILLTGYSDMQALLRSVNESEVFRFVSKPWDSEELPRIVGQAAAIAREPGAGAVDIDVDAPARPAEAVLVIDDDAAVARDIGAALGDPGRVVHARTLDEAQAALAAAAFGIVVADTAAGGQDTTLLLRLLKREQPALVSVVLAAQTDAVDLVTLINQGQIFRCMPKPVKPTTLRMALNAALAKRAQLLAHPALAARHAVDGPQQALLRLVPPPPLAPARRPQAAPSKPPPLLRRIQGSLKKLLGAG